MHPSFEQFVAALRDPAQRPGIGLAINDDDASALLTNANWANDYYTRWIAMFPAAAAAPVPAAALAAAPFATAATAAAPFAAAPFAAAPAASPFGPPPSAAGGSAFAGASDGTPAWAVTPPRRSTSPARLVIIGVLTLVTLSIIGGVINEVVSVTHTPVAARTPVSTAPPSSPADTGQSDPVVFHGLTQTEYDLIEAILAPQGHTLEEAIANGADDADLQRLATATGTSMAQACSEADGVAGGFDNASFRSAFIGEYESKQKATPAQANAVYDALTAYCEVH